MMMILQHFGAQHFEIKSILGVFLICIEDLKKERKIQPKSIMTGK